MQLSSRRQILKDDFAEFPFIVSRRTFTIDHSFCKGRSQKELAQLGYHSQVDDLAGPQTEGAIRWFQSVDKLPVTGQIDEPTLRALRIS